MSRQKITNINMIDDIATHARVRESQDDFLFSFSTF